MKALLSIILLLTFGACAWDEYTPSPEEFAEWKEAAENGEVEAQDNLGEAYFFGNGVLQDYKEGVKWYRKAAEPVIRFRFKLPPVPLRKYCWLLS